MSFQTFTTAPNFPPADGRTRAVIGAWVVGYDPPTAPTLQEVQAQAAPLPTQISAALHLVAKAAFASQAESGAQRDRAIALVVMDEINALRQWITSFKAAVATATSLANLQTRVAALANLPDRTAQQAKQAVAAKIDTSDAG